MSGLYIKQEGQYTHTNARTIYNTQVGKLRTFRVCMNS